MIIPRSKLKADNITNQAGASVLENHFPFVLRECFFIIDDTNNLPLYLEVDFFVQLFKIMGFVMHLTFFLCVIFVKEMHNRHSLYLVNLSIIGFIVIIYGLFTFDPQSICLIESTGLCIFQGIFAHYCIYLSSYGVLSLAVYRLACVCMTTLNHYLTPKRIIFSIVLVWFIPLIIVTVPKYFLQVPIYYNDKATTCRMNFSEHMGYFIFFLLFGNILPSILIAIIYLIIIYKIKTSKNKINIDTLANRVAVRKESAPCKAIDLTSASINNYSKIFTISKILEANTRQKPKPNSSQNSKIKLQKNKLSVQSKLTIQLIILYVLYEIYAISNTILVFEVSIDDDHWTKKELNILKLLIWLYNLINPAVYLMLHPAIMEKIKRRILFKYITRRKGFSLFQAFNSRTKIEMDATTMAAANRRSDF
jgi:hypothetical protein